MTGTFSPAPPGRATIALTRTHVALAATLLLLMSLGAAFTQFSGARDNILPSGATLGGDYIAFYAAARAAANGEAAAPYDAEKFEPLLKEHVPPRDRYRLTWQYPPTYYFIVLPLAFFAFAPGYALWAGIGAAAFFATLRASGVSLFFLFICLAAPATTHAVVTGQNGFITASFLAVAALYADKRPIVAGLAAAALTVKPQLGLLIPIAFAAAGCWRAFAVAAVGAVALVGASLAVFGAAAWLAFFEGAKAASDHLVSGAMPLAKMATPYAAARFAGAQNEVASMVYALVACVAAGAVALAWRRVRDAELRAAALLAGVFFVAPYGFYYELIILALPIALIAKRAIETGWLPGEKAGLGLIYILPMFLPGEARSAGFSLGFLIVCLVAACVLRRIAHDAPQVFKFSSAAFRRRSD